MHRTFHSSREDSHPDPTEKNNETDNKNNHNSWIVDNEYIPQAKVAELSWLQDEIPWTKNSRQVCVLVDVEQHHNYVYYQVC
jgi:hypothetical protein